MLPRVSERFPCGRVRRPPRPSAAACPRARVSV